MAAPAIRSTTTDEWVERAGRIGLTARGFVYLILAALAVALATGDRTEQTDQRGALEELAERPFGEVLLFALALGFVAYAAWRLARSVKGEGGEEPNAGQRALDVAKVVIYLAFAASAVKLVTDGPSGGSQEQSQQAFTARLMTEQSWGRWAIVLAGAGVIAYGAWQIWRGVDEKFRKRLTERFGRGHDAVIKLGVVGHIARGAVIAMIGWLVIRSAVKFDPNQPLGVDAAFREILAEPYGPVLAMGAALGLGAYGLYSFGEARFRQIS